MAMNRGAIWFLLGVLGALATPGCNKPSDESCRQAILNMQHILGTEGLRTDVDGEVRRCRGGSTKKSVECAIAAKTRADLVHCDFAHLPPEPPRPEAGPGSAPGSAAAPASGSAVAPATGSAAAAPATGSAGGAEPASGSAASAAGSGSGATP